MSARVHAESRKGISEIVVAMLLILIAITASLTIYSFTRNIIQSAPLEKTICFDADRSFSLEQACYLNENEIKIVISRSLDNLAVDKLMISFSPNRAVWEIKEKKCADIRLESQSYGEYCKVIEPGIRFSYVFNMAGVEKEATAGVIAVASGVECELGRIEITDC